MATKPKVYFGVPNRIMEIRPPDAGMGFVSSHDTEVTPLVSGGRAVYRAPLAFKTHNMTWTAKSADVQHIMGCYNGQWGPGPFYVTDPTANDLNVLPARWSLGWQLAYQANGWCKPYVQKVNPGGDYKYSMPVSRMGVFTQAATGTNPIEGILRTRVIKEPGKPYYLSVDGSTTGGAGIKVKGYNVGTATWDTLTTVVAADFYSAKLLVAAATNTYSMLELDFYMPLGSTMSIRGMALSSVNYATSSATAMPLGSGIGPVQFSGEAGGTLQSKVIDRIGLSLDLIEVQNVGA